eukprot:TRINITY_DN22474_c0_g1_i1.p1 TRINITY_DN22474_c0_g1~~TRINITY_DN22474_c0_g1_i1.p1  ORF type:complete len:152 (-),score=18.70 TRINITY_DN22474_c0_g1_i1:371-826(-)
MSQGCLCCCTIYSRCRPPPPTCFSALLSPILPPPVAFMAKKTLLSVTMCCERSKQEAMSMVAEMKGVDAVEADRSNGTITVTGEADPVDIATKLRKQAKMRTDIVSVENNPAPKKDDEGGSPPPSTPPPPLALVYFEPCSCDAPSDSCSIL